MKKLIASLILLGALSLSACGDKEAREYAAKMIPVLDSYQEQLGQKIKAEQDSYEELAKAYDKARKADIEIRLKNARLTRSDELAEEVANSKDAPSLSEIFDALQEYASEDFKTSKTLLEEGLDSRARYLTGLESLELELQKVKLLKEALKELAKSKRDFRKFKQATEFLMKTDAEFNKLLCSDLKKTLQEANDELKNADDAGKKAKPADKDAKEAAKNEAQEKVDRLKERMKTKKCE